MENQEKEYEQDEWKIALHTAILTAMTGNPVEKAHAYAEIGYYYQCCAPASLYKYYSDTPEKVNAVKKNKMWYSAPCNFNDVFDCDISIDDKKVFDEALKLFPDNRGIRPGSNAWKNFRATMNQQLRELRAQFNELRDTTGVSCLSESENSLLMWAHYANNHRGICVEYDLLAINNMLKFTAVPVIYSGKRTCFDFLNPQSIENDTMKLFIQSLTSKSPEWGYEQEWRIIRNQKACGDQWNADKKGALLDMIPPSSIILGCAAQPEFEREVTDYCSTNRIDLYKMEKDPITYCLNKKVVSKFGEEY
ncbi:DUF2971 domain-containing protein [Oscillibacter hominis]|uniref:DUF2971 domain-containing protein n=1 Tax=Oscillibacter hominis TaxID=2763056 RepID=A0A7G9B6G8_9FIRM|nr:DUF2971 domain-containing protein [Oscillibacter hominis]QNL45149.1 DUF2971 domain-containing protein [Oscillibacter hominis]